MMCDDDINQYYYWNIIYVNFSLHHFTTMQIIAPVAHWLASARLLLTCGIYC